MPSNHTAADVDAALVKDSAVLDTLRRLRARLGGSAFTVVDHWDCDLMATGIARPEAPDRLLYFSVRGRERGDYFVSLEGPPDPGSDVPYAALGDHEGVDFEGLVALVTAHLGIAPPATPGAAT